MQVTKSSNSTFSLIVVSKEDLGVGLYLADAAAILPLLSLVSGMELLSLAPLLLISLYAVWTMCTTSILHLNLRLLFVWQSIGALMFVAGRASIDATNFFAQPPTVPYVGSVADKFISRFGVVSNVLLTPVLVLERIVATHYVHTYEHSSSRTHYGLYALMLVVLLAAAFATVKDITSHLYAKRAFNFPTAVFYLLNVTIGIVAFMILLLVLRHNERSYKRELQESNHHSLSERYQRSENIRTCRQLLPVTLLHVLQNLPPCILLYLSYLGAMDTPVGYASYICCITLALCWFYIMLQLSMILNHPILRREALDSLHYWVSRCRTLGRRRRRVAPLTNETAASGNEQTGNRQLPNHHTIKAIDGRALIPEVDDQHAEHFKNLATFWEMSEAALK